MDSDTLHKLPLFVSDALLADSARTIVFPLLTFLVSQCLACSAFEPLGVACGNVQGCSRSLCRFSLPTGDLFLCIRSNVPDKILMITARNDNGWQ